MKISVYLIMLCTESSKNYTNRFFGKKYVKNTLYDVSESKVQFCPFWVPCLKTRFFQENWGITEIQNRPFPT